MLYKNNIIIIEQKSEKVKNLVNLVLIGFIILFEYDRISKHVATFLISPYIS